MSRILTSSNKLSLMAVCRYVRTVKNETELSELREKCSSLEAKTNARLIGPSLPPWIMEEKKTDPSDLEKLANADPATLRSRVLELESQVHELNQLLTYREDVILRIHEEISKKASRLEAAEVERSSLSAQVSILKRELACLRDDAPRRRGGYPPEIEIEIERLRGKRDREYQRRKRAETEMDELDQENIELKAKIKTLEEQLANIPPPKPAAPQGDPTDKSRIAELQAALSQLRMDNEAKRSELFDLRSRFDEKSAQLDKLAAEVKTKERAVADLSTELSSKISQLEYANKELESVRCRVVRGGSETERWQTDINSVRTTNRFLSAQANELRLKLEGSEKRVDHLQKQLMSKLQDSEYTNNPQQVSADNHPLACPACGEKIQNGISFADNNHDDSQIVADLKGKEEQCKMLEQRLTEATNKGTDLVKKLKTIETEHSGLQELYANLQTELEILRNSSEKKSECAMCAELKLQLQNVESDLVEANHLRSSSVSELNELREKLAQAGNNSCDLRHEINSLQTDLANSSDKLLTIKSTIMSFISEVDSGQCICSGDTSGVDRLRLATTAPLQ
ncbi:unnamed protein product [Dibothriocephalus latus]|uniref:Uncharacterized protein n=1 Tax=Dibothriocephalus latus TaxID=60516 RepID=A0A3P7MGC9_DIBLA|nr:unnamed protein product [Dibothriocephalus latus]